MQVAFPRRHTTFHGACGGVAFEARKPMSRARSPIDDLRLAIDCLPVRTRRAMLDGIRSSEIIVGAYSDRAGGVCPMLAAHRCGGRTSFVSFAHAWDRFAEARRARRATPRELRILEGQLEASLLAEDALRPRGRDRRARGAARGARRRATAGGPGGGDAPRPLGVAARGAAPRGGARPGPPRGRARSAPRARADRLSSATARSGPRPVRGKGRAHPGDARRRRDLLSARRTRTPGTEGGRLP